MPDERLDNHEKADIVSTFGIVALSLLGGLFLAILTATLGLAVYLTWKVKQKADLIDAQGAKVYAWTEKLLGEHETKMAGIFESAKSNLASIRQEVRGGLELSAKETRDALKTHQEFVQGAIGQINAVALAEASNRAIIAMQHIEQAVGVLREITLAAEEEEPGNVTEMPRRAAPVSYGAGDYAPPASSFVTQIPSQRTDAEAMAEEALEVETGA